MTEEKQQSAVKFVKVSTSWFTKYRTTDKKKESSHYTYGMIVVFLTTQVSNNTFEDFFKLKVVKMIHRAEFYQ